MMPLWYTLTILSHLAVCWLVWQHFRSPLTFGRWQHCWLWMAGAMVARFGLLLAFFWHMPSSVEVVSHLGISTGLFMSLYTLRQIVTTGLETERIEHIAHLTIDQLLQIVAWDAGADRLFGWTEAEALTLTVLQAVVPPRDWEAHREELARFLAASPDRRILQRTYATNARHKNGQELAVEVHLEAQPRPTGEVYFTAAVRELVHL